MDEVVCPECGAFIDGEGVVVDDGGEVVCSECGANDHVGDLVCPNCDAWMEWDIHDERDGDGGVSAICPCCGMEV